MFLQHTTALYVYVMYDPQKWFPIKTATATAATFLHSCNSLLTVYPLIRSKKQLYVAKQLEFYSKNIQEMLLV